MRRLCNGRSCVLALLVGSLIAGCHETSQVAENQAPSFAGVSIKVGSVDDPAILAGVSQQLGEWEASRHGDIQVRDEAVAPDSLSDVDVVLFSAQRLGDLVNAGALASIPNAAVLPTRPAEDETGAGNELREAEPKAAVEHPFQYMDIAPAFREYVSRYGPERVALPLGGSALVLVYRRDAFESPANREAATRAGLSLEQSPTTWARLDALATFFHGRDWNGDGSADLGIALALGDDPEGVGDAIYLARAAALGLHRDNFSFLFDADDMTPRINSPPFVEALRGMVALKACGAPGVERFGAAAARESFRTGKVALLIDRAERAAAWSHGKPLGVAPLPGSERVFEPIQKQWTSSGSLNVPAYLPGGGGWLVGLNRTLSGARLEAALDFAMYLANPENTNRLRAERTFPMLPVRTDQMGQGLPDASSAPDVNSRLWSDAVSRTLQAERVIPGLRIPGANGYLSDLSRGRVAAAGGEAPEQALRGVAESWARRTSAAGTQRQLWHYRRSLNMLTTVSLPPEPAK